MGRYIIILNDSQLQERIPAFNKRLIRSFCKNKQGIKYFLLIIRIVQILFRHLSKYTNI